ncbi:MAG: biotin/lipoyl-binding protein [Deltaproteobacteria bacterium]|nr:biotin/lipoyl-binding protein [Deltaproteobacteria bacterium]
MQIGLRQRQQHHIVEVHADGSGYRLHYDGREYRVEASTTPDGAQLLIIDGQRHLVDLVRSGRQCLVAVGGETYRFDPESAVAGGHEVGTVAVPEITAPMPGKVTQVLVKSGDQVIAGDGLLILEAMKMENRLVAEANGTVTDVRVAVGDMVDGGQVLVVVRYVE